jgi:hypothetical protein
VNAPGSIRDGLLLLILATVIRGGVLLATPDSLRSDPDGYRRLAENLVAHGTFGADNVPTAFRPPLYPLVLAGCVALGDCSRTAIGVLHVVLGVATVWLVWVLGRWWGLRRWAAMLAALLVACDPILLKWSTQVMTETLAVFLATAGLVVLSIRHTPCAVGEAAEAADGTRRVPATQAVLAGAVLALGAICRPTLLLWAIACGVALFVGCVLARTRKRRNSQTAWYIRVPACVQARTLRLPLAFFFGLLLVLAPWAIRNQLQFGRPIVTTTHGGYTLLLANNPEFYEWLRTGPWGSVWRSDRFDADWDGRKPPGEVASDRAAYDEAWQTIRREPGTFVYSCLVRLGRFWSPLPHQVAADETPLGRLSRWAVATWYVVEFLLATFGIVSGLRTKGEGRRERGEERESEIFPPPSPFPLLSASWLWGLLLVLCLSAVHTFYWTDMRMRAPIMPVVALAAAAALGCGAISARRSEA